MKKESGFLVGTIKKYLLTGLLVWLPLVVTLWVLGSIVNAADQLVNLMPKKWQPEQLLGFRIPGFGFLVAVALLFVTGLLSANVLGQKVWQAWDSLLGRIPIVKSIYSSVKKVSESLFSDNNRSFKTPVLVPFPQSNIWTLAFISGSLSERLKVALPALDDDEFLPVYVPTTPNPTGGYYILVRKSDIRAVDLNVDEALKYIISLGMVRPDEPETVQVALDRHANMSANELSEESKSDETSKTRREQ